MRPFRLDASLKGLLAIIAVWTIEAAALVAIFSRLAGY